MRVLIFVLALVLVGCGKGEPAAKSAPPTKPAAWLVASAPQSAVDVKAAKESAAAGDVIAVRGKIGGRMEPISSDTGVFVLVDPAVPSCADMHGDACKTPWDYCCEAPESIVKNAATVQIVDGDGRPAVVGGLLSPLDEVIVKGKVLPRENDKTLVIQATEVFVASGSDGSS